MGLAEFELFQLLLNGGCSPLRGFMTKADCEAVCHNMKLTSGVDGGWRSSMRPSSHPKRLRRRSCYI